MTWLESPELVKIMFADATGICVFARLLERGVTEVELRTMLEHARELAPSHVAGRFVAETRHEGQDWAVVLEPDFDLECVAVVTVYN